jgi:serine/threonine protein kinase
MGEVYRARDQNLGRDVATKVLPSLMLDTAERVARFEREARILASLNHPHIAHVQGFDRRRDAALHRHGMCELPAALRVPRRYIFMKTL